MNHVNRNRVTVTPLKSNWWSKMLSDRDVTPNTPHWTVVGDCEAHGGDTGTLVRNRTTGMYALYTHNGCMRSLPQQKVVTALIQNREIALAHFKKVVGEDFPVEGSDADLEIWLKYRFA